jgi:hypothetical protein
VNEENDGEKGEVRNLRDDVIARECFQVRPGGCGLD